jgi:hypothetical protein
MSAKKIALDLIINIKKGDITLEELNEQLALAKKEMADIGDKGSEEFKQAAKAVQDLETNVATANEALKDSKKAFDKTADAQKKAAQGSSVFSKGLKAVGTAFKAMGIGLIVIAIKLFYDAISKNQRVVDILSTALGTIGILFEKVFNIIFNTVDAVSKASNGFEGLKNVISGLLTIAITPLKLGFFEISREIAQAQLLWEDSFFGGRDKDKILELTSSIFEISKKIKETSENAKAAGKQVVDNLGKAASEIGQVVTKSVEGISKISVDAAIKQAKAITEADKAAQIAVATQSALVEKYDRLAEKQRQIRDDERVSITDRIKANNQLDLVLDEQEKSMLAQAESQITLAKLNKAANGNAENKIALIEAESNKLAVLAQIEGFRSEQKVNAATLDREQIALNTTLSKSEADLAYERAKFNAEQIQDKAKSLKALKDLEDVREQEEMLRLEEVVEATKSGTQAEIDALIALDEFRETSRQANREADTAIFEEEKNRAELRKKRDDENKEAIKEQAEALLENIVNFSIASSKAEEARLQDTVNNTEEGTKAREKAENALQKQKEKSFKMEQQAAIGRALIDTAQGSIKAYTSQLIPGDPTSLLRGALAASLVAASGLAQVAAIKRQKFYGGSGGGVPNSQTPTLGSGGGGTQPIGFTPSGTRREQTTSRVIVVETDIRKATRDIDGIYSKAIVVE